MVPAWMVPPPPPPPPLAPHNKLPALRKGGRSLFEDQLTHGEEEAERIREMAPRLDLQPKWRSAFPTSGDSVGPLTYPSQ
ncbi:unnamed protein product [Nyctereutes procyonoides]|uniref:(raccoon dog) hypothetical protein n=1 Tax=Nyctereutes procyonoides TaxID=34880 RepID=A0A811ZTG6_NYCPR|nr:unnamed protein product [Nyctereutes procyonoides]